MGFDRIAALKSKVANERRKADALLKAKTMTDLELEHERAQDKIFGNESEKERLNKVAKRRMEIARARARPRSARAGAAHRLVASTKKPAVTTPSIPF